jgi:type IV secretion system protein TrbE
MFIRPEARKDVKGFSDLIDHFALVADGVVLTTTGLYVAGFEFTGLDMDALPPEECYQIANRLASKLRLGAGWSVQCDLIRGAHSEYCPEAEWPDPVSYLIDQERRLRFAMPGEAATRLSRYFLALCYEPALHGGRKAARSIFSVDETGREGPGDKALALFEKRLAEVESLLRNNVSGVQRLGCYTRGVGDAAQPFDSFLQYVRHCITGENYPFALPEIPIYLNQYLAADDFTGGAQPQLGDPMNELLPGKRIAVLAIDGFPEQSFAGILRELDSLPFDFRYCQQAQLLDEQEAKEQHHANKNKWGFKKTPAAHKLSPIKVGESSIDGFALEMERDASQAMSAAEHGKEIFVRFTAKVIVMETDPERLKHVVREISRVIKYGCGFSCRLETLNAVAAWLATFPGQHFKDKRTFLINTANMVHMMPLSAPFRGHAFNPSQYFPPRTPPLLYGVTSGGTPYRFQPHVTDVGHQLVVGPIGSGKSVWLAAGIVQWFRYPNAQVFAFDKKKTLYTLCKAMGGDFYDISPDRVEMKLCPLQDLETPTDRDRAAQWIELLLVQNDLKVNHAIRNHIQFTIALLTAPGSARSLTNFHMAVPDTQVKEALEVYLGGLLDGDRDNLSMSRFCVFEMDELYRLDKKTMNGALFYIFDKIRRRLTSRVPTLVTVDEFREALEHPMAAKAFDEFLFEGRKLNMAVWLVLQELSKALQSPLKNAILQQCFTKVCLPNPQAILEGAGDYELLGMTARDRERIAHAEPKSEYLVTSPDGKRMISLELGRVALSFLAASSDADRALVDTLQAREGKRWPAVWLRLRGLGDWADLYDTLIPAAKEAAAYA